MEKTTLANAREIYDKVLWPLREAGLFGSFEDDELETVKRFHDFAATALTGDDLRMFEEHEDGESEVLCMNQEMYFLAGYLLGTGPLDLDLLKEIVTLVTEEAA